ncbi:MAG TPA: TetR/AcrR family transcriptional regulator [Thermoleophilaceae bacterium]|nr:TetR/AcrR family transcriptional regulator [Thermoleophilaceae bacterium]
MPRRAKVRPEEAGGERVLAAGRELFAERGYHATSIADIGERAGIAKSVLYHHFGSKAQLYEAIVEAETRDLIERVRDAVPTRPGASRLRPGVEAYLGFLAERPAAWRLLLRDPPAEPALIAVHERLSEQRAAALAELLATPGKRLRQDPHLDLTATAIRAFAAWWYQHRDVPREQVVEAILDVARAGARRLTAAA